MRDGTIVALVALAVPLALTTSARAQCEAGWVPGVGTIGTAGAYPRSLAVLPGGDVIVGGGFTSAGGVEGTNRIARLNPDSGAWSALGSGVNLGVATAVVALQNGDLLAGGAIGGSGLYRYNASTNAWTWVETWQGAPLVNALAVLPGGDVIAGGQYFRFAGGSGLDPIARYNPTTGVLSPLGTGPEAAVFALAVLPNGDVIVGGVFTSGGGVPANGIARFNPSTGVWSSLGTGIEGHVYALAVLPDGDVIAGGSFTSAGGVPASRIARYNPSTGVWSSLGNGTSGTVWSLAVMPDGGIVAGGAFGYADGVMVNHIAHYAPSADGGGVWSALGTGVAGTSYALAVLPGGDVIAAGTISIAGGVPTNRIARYSFGGTCCPADLDNDGDFGNGLTRDDAVTIDDLLSFLVGFEAGNVLVDLDNGTGTVSGGGTPDNAVTIDDLLFFLVRFEAGC